MRVMSFTHTAGLQPDRPRASFMDNPLTNIDGAIRDGVFQRIVDRFGFHPRNAITVLILIHAMLMAGMYAGYHALDAMGIHAISHFGSTLGVPLYGLLEVGFLYASMRLREYVSYSPIMIGFRVLMASAAILAAFLIPRVLFGTAADEFLDASGHTPFALRQADGSFILARWTFAAVLYLVICRKPPPRRRMAFA